MGTHCVMFCLLFCLVGISTQYEGEQIEIRYRIFDGEELIVKKSLMINYVKPTLVGHASMDILLKELENSMDKKIEIFIDDGALYETINGTSGTKNSELLKRAKHTRDEIKKFADLEIINVTGDYEMRQEWNKILRV